MKLAITGELTVEATTNYVNFQGTMKGKSQKTWKTKNGTKKPICSSFLYQLSITG